VTDPSKKKEPTLKDVALLAGSSPMAVSTVLSGRKSTVGVSAATRERILKAVAELHYRPNPFARSLRNNRTDTIGFFNGAGYLNTADPFNRVAFDGVSRAVAAAGRDLLLHSSVYADRRESVIQRVLGGKIDGVIVRATPSDESLLDDLRRGSLPAVVMAEPVPGLPSVVAEDDRGSREVARHLFSLGHRRVLYRRSAMPFVCDRIRFEAFRSEMEGAGGSVVEMPARELTDALTDEERALLLDPKGAITAVACWTDHSAVRTLRFCLRHGIDVPRRLAIAGFDGLAETLLPEGWTLTTFNANWRTVAVCSVELVVTLIDGGSVPDLTLVPGTLSIGRTTQG
jgi:DNA-binding LacI/PurR family transcriptional regulator